MQLLTEILLVSCNNFLHGLEFPFLFGIVEDNGDLEAVHHNQEDKYDWLIVAWILFSEVICVSNIKCQGSRPDYFISTDFIHLTSYSVHFFL